MTSVPFFFAPNPAAPPLPEPLAFWRFNEGSGTTAASETGTHMGTLVGTPTWPPGKSGTGIGLNGTSQYVTVPLTTALDIVTNKVSILAWINADTTAGARRIVCLPSNSTAGSEKYSLMISDGQLQMWIRAPITDASAVATFTTTGEWTHVAGVYNGTDIRLYINGSLSGTPTSKVGNIAAVSDNSALRIGSFSSTFTQYFDGIIDDVRLYDLEISASEVATIHALG